MSATLISIEKVADLLGQVLAKVEQSGDDEIHFTTEGGRRFKLYHSQDCCEGVTIEDICGDLSDLVGTPLLQAEESSNSDNPKSNHADESHTWTFYRFATMKGSVVIRWYGTSNGWYSESVDFAEIT
jgi:hypothetical protein